MKDRSSFAVGFQGRNHVRGGGQKRGGGKCRQKQKGRLGGGNAKKYKKNDFLLER